jgi:NADPH-dependent 2,4-dienoyl-CoA reductase/sulfur reductase-like enzyme
MSERVVVIGGDAAGMSAASQAKRLAGDRLEIVVLERSHHTSYSACGIPYWIGGDVVGPDALVARTAQQHRANGIDLRLRQEVIAVDLDRREVQVRVLDDSSSYALGFDQVVLAMGAVPVRPPWPGVDAPGVYGVQTLDDGQAVLDALNAEDGVRPRRAVVVGGGYIGVEMAEALIQRGLEVSVVDRAPEPMTTLDPDMGAMVHAAMQGMGIDVRTGTDVEGFAVGDAGVVKGVLTADGTLPADLVVLGTGVRPNTALVRDSGLPLGTSGGVRTDLQMRVPGLEGVWAGGDCVETRDLVAEEFRHVPLGTHANKHGRVIGTNLGGGYATFPGVVGTAVSKVCALEIARTGLGESDAATAGFACVVVKVETSTRAGYYPGARPMTVKMLAERRTGRLLGAQIVGEEGAAKRIDACAVALWNAMTVEEMTSLDLSYAPPFAPVWDPVLIAARKAADAVLADLTGS